jgi:transcriptional regulator with XRE-family HTH domain
MISIVAERAVGRLLRDWRLRRGQTQMGLAFDIGVSARHLSFVETGRSKPSPELLIALAEGLEIPLRERNTLLLAAGYAPRYRETTLSHSSMTRVHLALQRLLQGHSPYPGVVLDRQWNSVLANDAASQMLAGLPDEVIGPPANVFRVCLHPDGLASRTLNFDELAAFLIAQLHRLRMLSGDPRVELIAEEVISYPNVAALGGWRHRTVAAEPALLVPWLLRIGGTEYSFFVTLTKFATPQDITLDELTVELFYPADDATEAVLRVGSGREQAGAASQCFPELPQKLDDQRDVSTESGGPGMIESA